MSVHALSPLGARRSTVDRPRGEALPIDVIRVPVDRVSLSADGPWARGPHSWVATRASSGDAAVALTSWPLDPSSAVELLPVISTRSASSRSATKPKMSSGDSTEGAITPPTVADRARSAVHARLVYARTAMATDTPVAQSARGTGLDSPPDTPAPDILSSEAGRPRISDGVVARDTSSRTAATSPAPSHRSGAQPKKRELTVEQQLMVEELKARDRQVRSHEAAHMAAGGTLAGAASYSYERGPDGRSYAVGGEVSIELSAGSNPRETIERARQIRAAALAPADPSGQDLRVAAAAEALEMSATLELAQSQRASRASSSSPSPSTTHVYGSVPCAACAKASAMYKMAP